MSPLNPAVASRPEDDEREQVVTGPRRVNPAAALIVAVLGAVAIMVSATTPWTWGVAACGAVAVAWGSAILIVGLVRRWW